jgi:hypothetical protein
VPKPPSPEASRQVVLFSVNQRVVPGLADIVKLTRCTYPSNVTTSAPGSSCCGPSRRPLWNLHLSPTPPALIFCPAARWLRSPSQSGSCLIDGQRLGDASCAIHRPGYVKCKGNREIPPNPQFRHSGQGFGASSWRQAPGCCIWPLGKASLPFEITVMLHVGLRVP